jgi:hypothetical protein
VTRTLSCSRGIQPLGWHTSTTRQQPAKALFPVTSCAPALWPSNHRSSRSGHSRPHPLPPAPSATCGCPPFGTRSILNGLQVIPLQATGWDMNQRGEAWCQVSKGKLPAFGGLSVWITSVASVLEAYWTM